MKSRYTEQQLAISPSELQTVKRILKQHLPAAAHVWVYGSRANGNAKRFSDLDLAIELEDGKTLDFGLLAQLAMAFDESELPWKVDILDINSAPESFLETARNGIPLESIAA